MKNKSENYAVVFMMKTLCKFRFATPPETRNFAHKSKIEQSCFQE